MNGNCPDSLLNETINYIQLSKFNIFIQEFTIHLPPWSFLWITVVREIYWNFRLLIECWKGFHQRSQAISFEKKMLCVLTIYFDIHKIKFVKLHHIASNGTATLIVSLQLSPNIHPLIWIMPETFIWPSATSPPSSTIMTMTSPRWSRSQWKSIDIYLRKVMKWMVWLSSIVLHSPQHGWIKYLRITVCLVIGMVLKVCI